MKEVKIYTIVSDQLSPPITGESFCTDMVRHSDYAELEDKYAALAADNDKAMESLKQADAVVKLAHEKFSALAAENETLKYQEPKLAAMMSCLDAFYADEGVPERAMMAAYNILRKSVGTPATDAFLAEVRAQGVEMFSEKFGGGTPLSNLVKEVATDFAAKLRKGVAQ
ncbi:hypothetical protein ONN20_13960 [Salmonella enterica subsp. enterica serovar Virginia]|uniref:Eae-like protein n=3 Tax=Salmonella enterica TaxID=28901 RepID=A0A608D1G4_SALMU|nr:hypothetical protein [Salmonella enterica]EAB6381056.1 hypothetical protein [Salmonella enterica subsp. enterica serovar Emek]EBG6876700.1 hypothetical protein [Salmonella enterica subsp. enterica]EBR9971050.1 hypothetical protein [Salmonella enterica subsp. enterica serovar Enteritidis]EBU6871136.1 hypothetical protein [Salmonella enterica subsp. enterica serovar Molade]EBV2391723.1 hypothetical protein [Salmonella enterica subsp. enterica serovar Corvallis]EBV5061125.1 hypothetical prote